MRVHLVSFSCWLVSVSLLLSIIMIRRGSCRGFLAPPPVLFNYRGRSRDGRRTTFSHDFDGLMDDVLSRRITVSKPGDIKSTTPTISDAWRHIDWKEEAEKADTDETLTHPSPVDVISVRGDRLIYVKRDDQLRLPGSQISGNKARKMLALQQIEPSTFPSCIVSHGGPQSNAMLALAAVVHFQNRRLGLGNDDPMRRRFVYYTKKLPRFLRNQPSGNLFRAMSLGTEIMELSPQEYSDYFASDSGGSERAPQNLIPPVPGDSVFIPQGGACAAAASGSSLLAREIFDFCSDRSRRTLPWTICIPGGTCTTAGLVHRVINNIQSALPEDERLDIKVVVIPCVGDELYARRQMMNLNSQMNDASKSSANVDDIPAVLAPFPRNRKQPALSPLDKCDYFTFGEPHIDILNTYREMEDNHGIVLDLLYNAPAWTIMLRHLTPRVRRPVVVPAFDPASPLDGRTVMYVHTGGCEGINTQLLRYKYKNLVDEIQLPGRSAKR